MTDWRSLRGGNFLAPEHLENGPALVTIVKVHSETMLDEDEKAHKEVMLDIKAEQREPDTGKIIELSQTEWKANVVNCELLEALFGTPHIEQWEGRKMVVGRVPCEVPGKYFSEPAVRVIGGPDLPEKISVSIVLKMKGGKKRKPIIRELKRIGGNVGGNGNAPQQTVNPTTGEVVSPEPAPAQQQVQYGDAGAAAAQAAFTDQAPPADEEPPGRGPEFDVDDPNRPGTATDRRELSDALALLPESVWRAQLKLYMKDIQQLTHGEALELKAWAEEMAKRAAS